MIPIPLELEHLKDYPIWGLFNIDPASHKKSPYRFEDNRIQSCNDESTLWDYKTAVSGISSAKCLTISLPLASKYLGYILKVVDLDTYKEGFPKDRLAELLDVNTFIDYSISGEGYHLWQGFNIPPPKSKTITGVDHIGGFVTISGKVYREAHIPVVQLTEQEKQIGSKETSLTLMNNGQQSIAFAVNVHHNIEDVLQRYGYEQRTAVKWLSPNSDSGAAGVKVFPSYTNPYDLCYSFHGSDEELHGIPVDAFELIAQCAYGGDKKRAGRELAKITEAIDPETGEILSLTVEQFNERQKYLIPVPILQELADELFLRQRKPSYPLAVAFVIVLAARATARIYYNFEHNTPAALYVLLIGPTGVGKELLFKSIYDLYDKFTTLHIFGMPKSGAGYISDIQTDPAALHLMDEFGLKLEQQDKNFMSFISESMQIFGRSQSVHYPGSYSKRDLSTKKSEALEKPITKPAVSQLAMSTWAALKGVLEDKDLSSGFINRYFVVDLGDKKLKRSFNVLKDDLPAKFSEYAEKVIGTHTGDLSKVKWVKTSDSAELLIQAHVLETDAIEDIVLADLCERRHEIILRICTILAAWDKPSNPIINKEIAEFVIRIIKENSSRFEYAISTRHEKGDFYKDLFYKHVLPVITEHRGKIGKTELFKLCRPYAKLKDDKGKLTAGARDKALEEWVAREYIVVNEPVAVTGVKKKVTMITLDNP